MRKIMKWMIVTLSLSGLGVEVGAAETGVQAGDRVRIKMPSLTKHYAPAMLRKERISPFVSEVFLIGRVETIDGKILKIQTEGGDSTASVSMHDVTGLEVWSQGSYKASGTLLGLMGGAILGGVVGSSLETEEPATRHPDVDCTSFFCEGSYQMDLDLGPSPTLQGVLLGGLIGAVTGRLIGSAMIRDQWDSVDVNQFRARVVTGTDGSFGLACSVGLPTTP